MLTQLEKLNLFVRVFHEAREMSHRELAKVKKKVYNSFLLQQKEHLRKRNRYLS